MNYKISDFIIRIKNAALAKRKRVELPYSTMNKAMAKLLIKERYLEGVKEEEVEGHKVLVAQLAYEKRTPILTDAIVVSKPSLRVYVRSNGVKQRENKGRHTLVLSTNQGVISGKEAIKKGLGGELLFEIW